MLVFKDIASPITEGEWFDREIWGQNIRLKLRPLNDDIAKSIRKPFEGLKEGRKKEEKILDAVYDYVLEDFEGVGDEQPDGTVQHWEPTLENKKRILMMRVPIGEQGNLAWVIDRANQLAFRVHEDAIKN